MADPVPLVWFARYLPGMARSERAGVLGGVGHRRKGLAQLEGLPAEALLRGGSGPRWVPPYWDSGTLDR